MRQRALGGLAAAATIALMGCGGGGESASTPPPATKAQFIKQAAAVCADERANVDAEVAKFRGYPSSKRKPAPVLHADVAHFVVLPVIEEEINGIEELRLPPGDEKEIDKMLSAERIGIDKAATTKRMPSRNAIRRYFIESDELFREYGLDACTNGPGQNR